MEDNEFERNVTRFPLPVRDLKFDNEGKFLAVASDDAEIRLVDVADPENMKTLEGHDGGVKSLAFCLWMHMTFSTLYLMSNCLLTFLNLSDLICA